VVGSVLTAVGLAAFALNLGATTVREATGQICYLFIFCVTGYANVSNNDELLWAVVSGVGLVIVAVSVLRRGR